MNQSRSQLPTTRIRLPRRRVTINPINQSRSHCPALSRQRLSTSACHAKLSLANYFTAWSRAAPRTRSLRAEPMRAEAILPQGSRSPRRSSPHDLIRDARARHNDLAFSCEAANAMNECPQDAARLRLLQRRVRWLPCLSDEPELSARHVSGPSVRCPCALAPERPPSERYPPSTQLPASAYRIRPYTRL
jgi:hypothetical protein